MASTKQINDAFLTRSIKNDIEIEKATRRNLDRIDDKNKKEIHQNLMRVLSIKSEDDSKYYDFSKFKELIKKFEAEQEAKKLKKIQEQQQAHQ